MMKHPDTTVGSISDVLEALKTQYDPPKDVVWFRGQADATWTLQPSLYRPPYGSGHEGAS